MRRKRITGKRGKKKEDEMGRSEERVKASGNLREMKNERLRGEINENRNYESKMGKREGEYEGSERKDGKQKGRKWIRNGRKMDEDNVEMQMRN